MAKAKILSVRIERKTDDCPDTSWLGEYSRNPGPADKTIDRAHDEDCASLKDEEEDCDCHGGDMNRGEYRYFVSAMSGEETGNPASVRQDYERMERLNRGDWCFLGIIAKAEIVTPGGICQVIRSGGLWGVESDSGDDYLSEVARDELAGLRDELLSLGFGKRAIDYAFRQVETEDA